MSSPKSFTGRNRRRRTRWTVRLTDKLAHGLIVGGGIGAIVAVSLVCVFLLWVVLPLFEASSVASSDTIRSPFGSRRLLHLATDEYQIACWGLSDDGAIEVVRLAAAETQPGGDETPITVERRKLFADGPALTAAAFSLTSTDVALGFADGSIRLGEIGFRTRFVDEEQLGPDAQGLRPGQVLLVEGGLIERTPEGQMRRQELSAEFGEPLAGPSSSAITHIDMSQRPSGPVLATRSADGALAFHQVRSRRGLDADQATRQLRSVALPLEDVSPSEAPLRVLVSGVGDNVFAAWPDGRLLRYDVKNFKAPALAESIDLVPESDARLTALEFMIGKTTLAAGDSLGRVRGWFRVNEQPAGEGAAASAAHLVAAHDLAGEGRPVVSLAPSARSRMFAAGYADGRVRLYYLTNDDLLLEASNQADRPCSTLAISPKDDGLLGGAAGSLSLWKLNVTHPEVTLRSLFLPVWYEGNARPTYDWQSSGGTDDFEPKLGLMPLIFGTLKVTLYSLLFGVPLALLAAVYTSEFLHPRARTRIKPTIELMASLPSVVLGFVAALILAPLVEGILPEILTSLVTIPFTLLLGAFLWQTLPSSTRLALGHYRLVLMCLALPAGAVLSWKLGPLVERWLFAGDIKTWLDGGADKASGGWASGGWMLLLVPLAGLTTAWLLASYVHPWLRRRSTAWSEARMAGVELVKFGGAAVVALLLAIVASRLLAGLGLDPRGSFLGAYNQRNVLIVGFVMGFAIIPIIYTIAEDALSSVPQHLRSASLGAGATPWQTATRIIIPTAMSGLFSAVMVGLGRAVGETMIVLMAAGNTPVMDWNLFSGGRSLSANLAVELAEAVRDSTHYRTLFFAALVLFALTFVLNTVAESVRQRFRKRAFQL
ncbi:MAG TPA: ABC transporter permease subunit [Pirellulales bacterium]|nr:ABC transporter permease subunit [Pirellulales bacterium]